MILEAMYNGEFYPCETVVPTSPEYRKAVIACEKLMEQLSQRLSKEDYELVQELRAQTAIVPFPVSWTVKMKKKQKETQDILSYHSQAAGCSDKARAKASGGRQPIEECGRTGL